jgi:hypothetical protein
MNVEADVVEHDAVRARLDALWSRFDRLDADDLQRVSLPRPDEERRATVLAEVEAAAAAAGRGQLLRDARERVRTAMLERLAAATYRPTWAGLNWGQSLGTAEDRVRMIQALEDAAAGAVVADLVDPEIAAELGEGFDRVEAVRRTGPAEGSAEAVVRTASRPVRLVGIALLLGSAGLIGFGLTRWPGDDPLPLLAAGAVAAVLLGRVSPWGRNRPGDRSG